MKITPNNSLFSALSNFPSPADVQRRTAVERQAGFESEVQGRRGQAAKGTAHGVQDARDAIMRQALKDAARQQATAAPKARAPAGAAVAGEVTGASRPAESSAVSRREAPFPDSRPKFVRLGQIVDLRI